MLDVYSATSFVPPNMPMRCAARFLLTSSQIGPLAERDPPQRRPRKLGLATSFRLPGACVVTAMSRTSSCTMRLSFESSSINNSISSSISSGRADAAIRVSTPRKRGRPKGSKSKNRRREQEARELDECLSQSLEARVGPTAAAAAISSTPAAASAEEAAAAGAAAAAAGQMAGLDTRSGAPVQGRKRGGPKGSISTQKTGERQGSSDIALPAAPALGETQPPPLPSLQTAVEGTPVEPNIHVTGPPRRRISHARTATATHINAAAMDAEAVASARAEAVVDVASAAAGVAAAHAGGGRAGVSNSVMLTGRNFFEQNGGTAASGDGKRDLTAAAVVALNRGSNDNGIGRGAKGRRPPSPNANRRTRSTSKPLEAEEAAEEEGGNPLIRRAEVDAILSEAGVSGIGTGVGIGAGDDEDNNNNGLLSGGAVVAASVARRDDPEEEAEIDETEEVEFDEAAAGEEEALRSLMGDVGFGEDEVAAYSLEELLLLREELESEWAAAENSSEIESSSSSSPAVASPPRTSKKGERETKKNPWRHHSLSLQERLGLTDEEVDRLRRSPRSGLAVRANSYGGQTALEAGGGGLGEGGRGGWEGGALSGCIGAGEDRAGGTGGAWEDGPLSLPPASGVVVYDGEAFAVTAAATAAAGADSRLRERLTGRSAGGPETAVGYLLGELRMRPEEVRDAVLRWPALLSLSNRGPHAVASWLQGGLGLSAEDVGKMIKKNPAMVSCSIVHNLRPKLRWLQQEVGLSRPHAVRLIVRCPSIFAHSIDDNMALKVEWLQATLGFSRREAARAIYANPGILLSSVEDSLMPKIQWMAEALQMDEEMVFDMVRRFPAFFTLSSNDNLAPKLEWLSSHASSKVVRRALFRQPSLLGHNADGNLAPKVQWLQDRLGMTEAAAWKFIGRSPAFLTLSVSDNLEPKLWWLRDKLDVSLAGAAKILTTYPNLFGLSIEANLEPKLWWVRDALGLDRPDAANILRRCPQIFGSSLKDTLEPKLSWLSVRLKADRERLSIMVKKYPQILTYSIEDNLAPTIDFFEFGMGKVEPSELMSGLEMKPSVLGASLGKRLLTRVSRMRRAGIEPVFSRDFRAVAQLTEPKFRAWMQRIQARNPSEMLDGEHGLDSVEDGVRPPAARQKAAAADPERRKAGARPKRRRSMKNMPQEEVAGWKEEREG